MKRKKGFFSISAVAQMFGVHQQTIRLYEREGLIAPKRSEGNTRLFSEEDVDRLEQVIYLTHKLGINLAGVQMIIKLQKQLKKMQKDVNVIFNETADDLEKQVFTHKQEIKQSAQDLTKIQKQTLLPFLNATNSVNESTEDDLKNDEDELDSWHIDYEE